jgi:hypothetical protein
VVGAKWRTETSFFLNASITLYWFAWLISLLLQIAALFLFRRRQQNQLFFRQYENEKKYIFVR